MAEETRTTFSPSGDRPPSRGPRPAGGPGGGREGGRKYFRRKKVCKFCVEKIEAINYKDVRLLAQFVAESGTFSVVSGTPTEHVHVAFETSDDAAVDAFHRELTAAGYRDHGAPGERDYHPGYYGAFVLDPDGHNIEVVCHTPE